MTNFNLNNHILVQITEYGWEYLKDKVGDSYITHCILSYETIIDEEKWYKLQAHQVISLFGNAQWIASHSPIKSNILIP